MEMEVQHHQEVEMTQVLSELYDIFHPTPVPLKQLSAIAISLQIWRYKVNEYRIGGKLKEFDPCSLRKDNTWMKTMLPDLPSSVYKTIEEVISRFGHSMEFWRIEHYERGFCFQYSDENHVLEDFDDFSCDYDGSIDYARTAERMMRCERFNSKMKFTVACMYFFENDIRRVWPSVSRNMNLDGINSYECPQLYYWDCLLTNKLHLIPTGTNAFLDERVFRMCMPCNRPSVEYFWNRVPVEKQVQRAVAQLNGYDFVRFILPKLNDQQLDEFVNNTDVHDLYKVFISLHCDEWVVLRTWYYIRNIIKESNFTNLIIRMFAYEYNVRDKYFDREKWPYLSCQIWNHATPNLKRSVIVRVISSDSSWFNGIRMAANYSDYNKVNVELLLTTLQDASLKERNLFWRNCWDRLVDETLVGEDLQRVIELCFENEDEINQFKQNVLVKSEDFFKLCVRLLECALFKKLNSLVRFCCPESPAACNFREQVLQSVFLDGHWNLTGKHVHKVDEFNDFVKDVSSNFKNRFISSPSFMEQLLFLLSNEFQHVYSHMIIKFIDTLVTTEDTVMQAKMNLIDALKAYLKKYTCKRGDTFRDLEFDSILLWCLGSNERVEEFRLNCAAL
ncbi:uncharacterized protein LOC135847741 [Planococcus citri]|uniref:uncharacterized protein LOC135847741 n=1 Tax=Planococcus citri TaxID=170843 RepID=UPI0031F8A842